MLNEIFIALSLIVFSYFDVFNDKNIPDHLLYLFGALSLILFLLNPNMGALIQASVVAILSYILYRMGQLGGAEIFIFSAISLLKPYSFLQIPFIFPLIIFSGIFLTLYLIVSTAMKINLMDFDKRYLLIGLLYVFLLYFIYPMINFNFLFILSFLLIGSLYVGLYKKQLEEYMIEAIPVQKTEEEVSAEDNSILKKGYVIKKEHIKRMKEENIEFVRVYKHLPPFIPFILLGFICALYCPYLLIPF